jgi:hypothetical protein
MMPSANTDSRVRPPPEKVFSRFRKSFWPSEIAFGLTAGQVRAEPVDEQHRGGEQQLAPQIWHSPRAEEVLEH